MKAYIVTAGEYSEYHIVGVALDEKIANALKKECKFDNAKIEEYEVVEDPSIIDKTKDYIMEWKIVFSEKGEIKSCRSIGYNAFYVPPKAEGGFCTLYVTVCADDQETAEKVAQDYRAKYLAEKFNL